VAASIAHGGIVSRLVAPSIGCATRCGHVLDLSPPSLWWQDVLGGPFPLSVPVPSAPDVGATPAAVREALLPVIGAVTAAVRACVDVSDHVLAGNVASAVNTAAETVAAHDPAAADCAVALADGLLADPLLAAEPGPAGPGFRRRSCCLAYRLEPGEPQLCGDCVLRG
jgi:hypothetical protein